MAIYTINALNMLIEYDSNGDIGNIVYETYKIDWDKYQGKLIITKNNELVLIDIERIFL
jgi:formylmethanofuran dehydrogenase subunit C